MVSNTTDYFGIIDNFFYNGSGSLISANELVMADISPDGAITTELRMTVDPYSTGSRGPLEGLDDVPATPFGIVAAVETAGVADAPCVGISMQDIPDGEWGRVRQWGPCSCKGIDTTDLPFLTAYGVSATAGQMEQVVTPSATLYSVCFQVIASGTTSAGDTRKVFCIAAAPQNTISTPFGILG